MFFLQLEFHLFQKGLLILMFQAYHIDLQIAKCHYQTMSCIKFHLNEHTVKFLIKRLLLILQL